MLMSIEMQCCVNTAVQPSVLYRMETITFPVSAEAELFCKSYRQKLKKTEFFTSFNAHIINLCYNIH